MVNLITTPIYCPICYERFGFKNDEINCLSLYPNILIKGRPQIRYISEENCFEITSRKCCDTFNHIFCNECIKNWSARQMRCPLCRETFEGFYSLEDFSESSVDTTGKTCLVFKKNIAKCSLKFLVEIVEAYISEKNLPKAKLIAMKIPDEKNKLKILVEIAKAYLLKRNFQEALRLLILCEQIAMTFPNEMDKPEFLLEIAKAYLQEAQWLQKLSNKIAILFPDDRNKLESLAEMAKPYLQKAQRLLELSKQTSISYEWVKNWALANMVDIDFRKYLSKAE